MNKTTIKKYVSLALLLGSTQCFADFVSGMEAYKAGDYTTAHKTWKKLADQDLSQGNWRQAAEQADAQFALALLYWEGKGVNQDYAEAKKWLELAANQGQTDAQLKLGDLYLSGLAGEPDFAQGTKWLETAATGGNIDAQYNLGLIYLRGIGGFPKDAKIAQKWLLLAEEQGDKEATLRLKEIDPEHKPAAPKSKPETASAKAAIPEPGNKTEAQAEMKKPGPAKTEAAVESEKETQPAKPVAAPVEDGPKPSVAADKQKPEAEQKQEAAKEPEAAKSTEEKPKPKPQRKTIVWQPHKAPEIKPAQAEDQKKQ